MLLIHATCVALAGNGLLLRGPSGAGKSDLALRLLDLGALLVADDQVVLSREGDRLVARAPGRLRGLLEVRGIGPVSVSRLADASPVSLIADLVPLADLPRMAVPLRETLLDIDLPVLKAEAFSAAAPLKLRLALELAGRGQLFTPADADWSAPALPAGDAA